MRSIGKSGLRFSKSKSGFPNRTRNPSSGWISIKKSKSGFFGFPFLSFDWEIRKRICKIVFRNSGLACTRIIIKKKTAVLENSFANPFSDFPIERQKGKSKKSGFGFLIEIHPEDGFLGGEIRFRKIRISQSNASLVFHYSKICNRNKNKYLYIITRKENVLNESSSHAAS